MQARLQQLPDDAPAIRLLGEINWRRGDMTEALALVERAVQVAPGFDLARDFLVRLLMQTNRLPEARELYERLLAQHPDQPQVWQNLGHVLKTLGKQSDAVQAYRQAVARQPAM